MRINRSDRYIILLLFCIIIAVWAGVLLERYVFQDRHDLVRLDEVGMDSLEAAWEQVRDTLPSHEASSPYYSVPIQQPETFTFDPNTADSTTLLRLGLAPWQVRSIYKYRARGGRYHRPEDFKRLPGMTPELWERLSPVVHIGEAFRYYDRETLAQERATTNKERSSTAQGPSSTTNERSSVNPSDTANPTQPESTYNYPHQEKFTELTTLDLNTVDSTTLKKVPGIASYRARQILSYRDRLGGFASVEQLSEIKNLPLELQAWFAIQSGIYRKLNLNTASISLLARHPYMGSARAKAIDNYRRSQGTIHSLSDLSLLSGFSQEVLQRLEPYVEF